MTTLYIVGNGFDLWHGLPTRYCQFNEFAEETLSEVANFYSVDLANAGPWCDFENSLGRFNWRAFYNAHNYIDVEAESFRCSSVYSLEDDLVEQADQHVSEIRDCFQAWVTEIDISMVERKLVLVENAKFLTFNYTSTLESVYGIADEQVLHIHGKAEAFDELIFGHGDSMEEEPELDGNGDSNRTIFSDAEGSAKYPFYALQKPVEKVLKTHTSFFDSLGDTSEIVVVGHSLNKIDLPYFKKVVQRAPAAQWKVCCFTEKEKSHYVQTLVECGVPQRQIHVCGYSDLESVLHQGLT
ncbi:bacteriophage abortive infection AbiH family protein [Uliginosibacterium sp. 31-16]|uniref:bacteriophage abortive infection AbiH family protein n=1 Tax=Uliginosibacterium sp. 31-16 TaxID=3068315 RepID=UPI00273FB165|nr:bacteriophage abortive infection AbiH family protein [Uliginosibacterium sp. 31-16]MDP5239743.1 bacteriophage abortive infection AbiH family protein [Uliginosibacterium sp. 31-16]